MAAAKPLTDSIARNAKPKAKPYKLAAGEVPQQWAEYLDALKAGGNVVPMRRKA